MAITRVTSQDAQAHGFSAGGVTATWPAQPTQGHLLIASVWANSSCSITGWTQVDTSQGAGALFYKIAGASESTSVAVTNASNVTAVNIYEYQGNATSNVLDTHNEANGGSPESSGSITTATGDLLFIGCRTTAALSSPSWTNSFTQLTNNSFGQLIDAAVFQASAGTYSTQFTWTGGGTAFSTLAAFKAVPTVNATLSATLGALSASATATPTVNATLAAPCGGLSATATATPTVAATLAAPLGSLVAGITATPDVEATFAAPLGALSAAITAVPSEPATLAAALGALTATATAKPTVNATLAAPLGALVAGVAAIPDVEATFASDLGALDASAAATVSGPSALLEADLGALVAAALADVTHPDVTPVTPVSTRGSGGRVRPVPFIRPAPLPVSLEASLTAELGRLTATIRADVSSVARRRRQEEDALLLAGLL